MLKPILIARDGDKPNPFAADLDKATFDHHYSAASVVVTISIAIAYYNSFEMVLLMSSTFKRYKGLYFWSLAICTLGVLLYTLGIMLGFFVLCTEWLSLTILDIGWIAMLTCQSLILYSRLGLILRNRYILAAVKWMIIFDSVVIGSIVIVLDFGSQYSNLGSFTDGYYYIEQIQLIWFTVQELTISCLYIWQTRAWLKSSLGANTRKVIWQLLVMNAIIIAMDVALVTLEYLHHQLYQEAIKAFVYSVKLKLELNILSKLVDLVAGSSETYRTQRSMTLGIIDASSVPAKEELQRELEEKSPFSNPFKSSKGPNSEKTDISDEQPPNHRLSRSPSAPDDAADGIDRVTSSNTRYTSRTSGRDSDIMYAEMIRNMA